MAKGNKKGKGKSNNKDDGLFASDEELEKKFDLNAQQSAASAGGANSSENEEPAAAPIATTSSKKKDKKKKAAMTTGFDAFLDDEPAIDAPPASVSDQEHDTNDVTDLPIPAKKSKKKEKKKPAAPVMASFDLLAETEEPADVDDELVPKKSSTKKALKHALSTADSEELTQKMSSVQISANGTETGDDGQDADGIMALKSTDKKKKKSKKSKTTVAAAEEEASPNASEPSSPASKPTGKSSKKKTSAAPAFRDADEGRADEEDGEKKPSGHFTRQTDHLTATGILLSHERSKDVQIDKFSVAAYGQQLVKDTSLNILYGHRYGLVGNNGCGKSTLLKALAHREVPIQNSVDLYLLEREYDATELTAVEAVVDIVKTERDNLEDELEELLGTQEGAESSRFEFIQERLNELDLSFAEQKARNVLHGLGFTEEMQDMMTREFSGGWRMRVALARALFVKPTILLLDDATNHLDLSAVVWLEDYLLHYPHTIIMVSHSQDFINSICTDIMHLAHNKLENYAGDYDNFVRVKAENDEALRKKAKADLKKMKKIKENLGRTGVQAKQAKSQEKAMMKRKEKDGGPTEEEIALLLADEKELNFSFQQCGGGLPSPFLKFNDVSFAYPGRPVLYRDLNFGLDLNSRVAIVGPNGAGKSTLMKLMCGELEATDGIVYRHHHLRIARFHQHLTEQLDLSQSAVEWMCGQFSGVKAQEMRKIVGRFGLTGKSQVIPMEQLSDGQRRRVVFSWLAQKNCHLLMLDEPTNFLDPETIDALAEGLEAFDGGVVLVSHDFRLIDQVAKEIWVVEDGTVEEWEGDIHEYKNHLKKKVTEE